MRHKHSFAVCAKCTVIGHASLKIFKRFEGLKPHRLGIGMDCIKGYKERSRVGRGLSGEADHLRPYAAISVKGPEIKTIAPFFGVDQLLKHWPWLSVEFGEIDSDNLLVICPHSVYLFSIIFQSQVDLSKRNTLAL